MRALIPKPLQVSCWTRRLVVLSFVWALAGTAYGGDGVVIASPNVAVTSLSHAQVKRMLSGQEVSWPDGSVVHLVLPDKGSDSSTWMCRALLKMPEEMYRRFVLEKAFSGAIPKPMQASDTAELIRAVADSTGSISVIPAEAVTAAVQVITID